MAVRLFKKSWWVDFRHNEIRYRKKSPDNTRAGAKAYEILLRQKLARGVDINPKGNEGKNVTFAGFAWEWFDVYVKNNNKISEIYGKRSVLKTHLIPFFGSTRLDSITGFQIEKYKSKKLDEGLCKKTINNHLTVFGKCMRSAQEWLDLARIPKISKMKTPPSKFSFFTDKESQRLLEHAGDWYVMVLVALRTGLRLGELRGLMWKDINWETRTLSVRRSIFRNHIVPPKSNKERHLPLTDELYGGLYSVKKEAGYVFRDPDSGGFLEENRPRRALVKIYRQAGLSTVGWHALRHTFASHLAMAGAPLKAVQELLGHANIQTTMRYAHLSPSTLQDTMNLLDPGKMKNFGQPVGNRNDRVNKTVRLTSQETSRKFAEIVANIKQKQGDDSLFLDPSNEGKKCGDGGS